MKILIITQYFWPENFRVNDIAIYLNSKNHEVDVLTSYPNYPEGEIFSDFKKNPKNYEKLEGIKIYRVPSFPRYKSSKFNLFINYLSFSISSIFAGYFYTKKKKYDVIFTFGTSPVTVALTSIFFSKITKTKTVLWLLDMWPNILFELNIVKENYAKNILKILMNFIYENTDYILIQSKSFAKFLPKNSLKNEIIYYPAWAEEEVNSKSLNLQERRNLKDDLIFFKDNYFKIVFTGNIGEAQNFDNIITTAEIIQSQNIKVCWIIVGEGRTKKYFQEIIKEKKINNFNFIGSRNLNEIYFYHHNSDALLISLKKGEALSATIPGKLQTYLNSNKFILGFIDGEAAQIIKDSKAGLVVSPDNPQMFARKIIEVVNNIKILEDRKHINVNNFSSKNFNKAKLLKNIEDLFLKIEDSYDKIKLIIDPLFIPFNKNFILSGLNLAFLGYYIKGNIILSKNMYHWPDGVFFKRFYKNKYKKIAGRNLLKSLKIPFFIKKIYVIGSLSYRSKEYLSKELFINKKIIHINLPIREVKDLYEEIKFLKFSESDLIILTLPTPKQEQLANLIREKSKFYKIICIGGAITMASGEEKMMPFLIDKFSLEFIWRLRTETNRRLKRLIESFFYYIKGELLSKFSSIKYKTITKIEEN